MHGFFLSADTVDGRNGKLANTQMDEKACGALISVGDTHDRLGRLTSRIL